MRICPSCHCGSYGRPGTCPGCGAPLDEGADRAGTDLAGMVIDGKYTLTELVGEGAMGWVYQGVHRALESTIAVKIMKPAPEPDDTRDQRFAREARAASRINNPHVISIIDFGKTPGGVLYIVSELLRGKTLAELIAQEGPLGVARAAEIMDQVLSAIDEAHSGGLIHRDLKPENIIITTLRSGEDFVKVLDFGIAKLAESNNHRLTLKGQLFGTPAYMAPEQIRGQGATARSDLYACGLILYEMLTGREAFPGGSVMEVLTAQLKERPRSPREVAPDLQIPEALDAVVMRCIEKDPEARFESAHVLRKAIHRAIGLVRRQTPASTELRPCPACRQPVQGSARFCPACGARLGEAPDQDAIPTDQFPLGELPERPSGVARRSPAEAFASDATLDAGLLEGWPGAAEASGWEGGAAAFPRTDSEEFLLSHTTLNRRLRVEQTLRFKLVDRVDELALLRGLIERRQGVAEIVGPVGSGRTRLLEVLAGEAREHGLEPVYACADPRLARVPWYPVRRILAQLLGLSSRERPSREALRAAALEVGLVEADLLGLSVLFGVEPPSGRVELAVRRRETRSVVLRTLTDSEPARRGLCLLLDDWDNYDAASESVLREVAVLARERGGVVIATGESGLLGPDAADLRVEPAPLGPKEVEALLAQAVDVQRGSQAEMVDWICRYAGGNALHVTQAVRLVAEGGSEVSEPLPDLIQTRISRLPSDALRVLQAIAALGWEAPPEHVRDLVDDDVPLEDALRLLHRRGIVAQAPNGDLQLAHPLLAEVVREMMPADARREMHRRALEVLQAAGEDPVTLARHAQEARAGRQSLQVLWQAALQAEERLDDHGAATYYRRALQMARWELLYAEDDEQCLDLALRLGETLHFAGDHEAAEMVLKEAVVAAGRVPATQARLLQSLARTQWGRGQAEAAIDSLRRAVRLAMLAGERELLAELYGLLGRTLDESGDRYAAVRELQEAVDLVTWGEGPNSPNAPEGFWRLLLLLADYQRGVGDVQGALVAATAAMDQATREGSDLGEARSHFTLYRILDHLGRLEAAERHHAEAIRAFRRLGDRRSTAEALLERASREPARSEELARQALLLSRQVAWDEGVRTASSMLHAV